MAVTKRNKKKMMMIMMTTMVMMEDKERKSATYHRHFWHAQKGHDESVNLTRGERTLLGGFSLGRHLDCWLMK